jgi:Na+/H+ antiporter NhaD/arsenite permease-like protein
LPASPPTETTVVVTALVFAATYLIIAIGRLPPFRIDRTGAAVVGAIVMVEASGLGLDAAWRAIDYRTLILLFGMMILIAALRLARFFEVLAAFIVARVHHPQVLLVVVVFTSGVLSALFVNDTVCLVLTPVLIAVARARQHRPLPYLLGLATASNIGSVATITGNPQNMLIGSLSQIGYTRFLTSLGPVALAGLAIDAAILCWMFRADLHAGPSERETPRQRATHRALMIKGLAVAAAVLWGLLKGFEPALVAAAGAAALLITRRVKPAKIYRQIDWDLLMLFVGLFVVVAGLEHAGLAARFFEALAPIGITTTAGLTAIAAVLSNVISNVPAVMLFARLIPQLPAPDHAWLTLAMASTLAGNLTLLGSIANLIVLEGASRHGYRITFLDYLKVGVPVTLLTLVFGFWWLGSVSP